MTSDTTADAVAAAAIVRAMETRAVDVLIGTQIIAKGHHFPDLTLVGVVDADLGWAAATCAPRSAPSSLYRRPAAPAARSGPAAS